jgi:hypothetical protein
VILVRSVLVQMKTAWLMNLQPQELGLLPPLGLVIKFCRVSNPLSTVILIIFGLLLFVSIM